MSRNPHQVTKDFEAALCEYTGAPYAVAVNSCTMALTLALAWELNWHPYTLRTRGGLDHPQAVEDRLERPPVYVPKRTYVSVPQAVIHAGGIPVFEDYNWEGSYMLRPTAVVDSARDFTSGMYFSAASTFLCVSFHASKTLGLEQGGAILHDNPEADAWFRRARFDGRSEGVAPKDDKDIIIGWHCYMNPSTAAQGILKLHSLPRHNAPLPNDEYPDLSQLECFK